MSKYNETDVTSTSYQRANFITISNEVGQTPNITFNEEVVVELPDGSFAKKSVGMLHGSITEDNQDEAVFLIDPVTGEPSQVTMTFAEIHNAIRSLYLHMAIKRDSIPAVTPLAP